MALPSGKQESKYETIEPGNYPATLKMANLNVAKEFDSDQFNNGEGLIYQAIELTWDVDGTDWTEKFIKVSMHEKAKLYNRFSALLGRKITEADEIHWGVAKEAETDKDLDEYYKAQANDPAEAIKKGDWVWTGSSTDGIVGAVHSIKVNDTELIGATCLLELDINKGGYNRAAASAASALPKGGRGRKASEPEPVEPDDENESEQEAVEASAPARGRGRTASKPAEDAAPTRGRRQPPTGAPR